MTAQPTAADVLATPMGSNDANAATIRGYLIALLAALWEEGEGFSGKRPLGNSGWEWDLYVALVTAGHVPGRVDEGGCLEDVDHAAADDLIATAIRALGEDQP